MGSRWSHGARGARKTTTNGCDVERGPVATQRRVVVGLGALELAEVVSVARAGVRVELSPESVAAIEASRAHVEDLASSGRPVYGVSTGFGALATRYIEPAQRATLQRSLIRSHAAGSGPCVETEVVRALMLNRLSTLATGRTGVRLGDGARRTRTCSTLASRRAFRSTGRWAARAIWPRWRTARWR